MYWLSNLCLCCFDVIGSDEPHRYFIDCFLFTLNIELVFLYQNYYVSHCYSVFALKLLILLVIHYPIQQIILIIRCNQVIFQIYFPLTYPLFTHFHFHYKNPFARPLKFKFISHYNFYLTSHYLIPINDRNVNCRLYVYSSHTSAVCLL